MLWVVGLILASCQRVGWRPTKTCCTAGKVLQLLGLPTTATYVSGGFGAFNVNCHSPWSQLKLLFQWNAGPK